MYCPVASRTEKDLGDFPRCTQSQCVFWDYDNRTCLHATLLQEKIEYIKSLKNNEPMQIGNINI